MRRSKACGSFIQARCAPERLGGAGIVFLSPLLVSLRYRLYRSQYHYTGKFRNIGHFLRLISKSFIPFSKPPILTSIHYRVYTSSGGMAHDTQSPEMATVAEGGSGGTQAVVSNDCS